MTACTTVHQIGEALATNGAHRNLQLTARRRRAVRHALQEDQLPSESDGLSDWSMIEESRRQPA
jgi:hypothetical protein